MRWLIKPTAALMAMLIVLFNGSFAHAVTSVPSASYGQQVAQELHWAHASISQRAHSDIQLRRLMNLLVHRQISSEDFFDRMLVILQSSRP